MIAESKIPKKQLKKLGKESTVPEMEDLREGVKSVRSEGIRSGKEYIENKQGRSKVLTKKTIQGSVVCFYIWAARKTQPPGLTHQK